MKNPPDLTGRATGATPVIGVQQTVSSKQSETTKPTSWKAGLAEYRIQNPWAGNLKRSVMVLLKYTFSVSPVHRVFSNPWRGRWMTTTF
jgi:hypothetical protein